MRQMANVFLAQSLAIVLISTNVLLTKTFKGKAWGSQVKVTQLCPLFVTPWTNSPWNFPRQRFVFGFLLRWVVTGVLTISLVGALALEQLGSVVAAPGLSCPLAWGILVAPPGIESMSPTLEGGYLTTGSRRKS